MSKLLKIISSVLIFAIICSFSMTLVNAEEDNNWLDIANSTFESGQTDWFAFAAGTAETVDNPSQEGKCLKFIYSDKKLSYESAALDLRPIIQKNLTEGDTVYISLDFYVESDQTDLDVILRIRTKGTSFSLSEVAGNNYPRIGYSTLPIGEWVTIETSIEITDEDLKDTDSWNLCFDSIVTRSTAYYIDNVYISDEMKESKAEPVAAEKLEKQEENFQIGTIRWDSYTKSIEGGTDSASQVAKCLSPAKYHWTAPFFAQVEPNGNISFPEYTMQIWEEEAQYAIDAGIDYFAYLWYAGSNSKSAARKFHLQSSKKNEIKMCAILEKILDSSSMDELFSAMKEDCYLKLNGMPVLFIYDGLDWTAEDITKIRVLAATAEISRPLYIVGMGRDASKLEKASDNGYDAFSWYGVPATKKAMSYQELTTAANQILNSLSSVAKKSGLQIIPSFTAGRDSRARIETGVSWVKGDPKDPNNLPYSGYYALSGTADEIANHAFEFMNWVKDNPEIAAPNLLLSYGWNEHDEGGWLCPTLACDENGNVLKNEDGSNKVNTERLDALKSKIMEFRGEETGSSGTSSPINLTDTPSTEKIDNTTSIDEKENNYVWIICLAVVAVAGCGIAVFFVLKKKR